MYRITALKPTEPENYHEWQRSLAFPLLLSVNDCEKYVQATKVLPSVSKIHYYLPENDKCIDSGCSMMADICRGDGGIYIRFLTFGTLASLHLVIIGGELVGLRAILDIKLSACHAEVFTDT